MKTLKPSFFQFLGVLTNGDAGPYTFYTSKRKRLVVFLKTWPKDPASYNQKLNRDKWRHAAVRWRSLQQSTRDDWETISRRAHLTITGFNLFMHYMTKNGTATVQAIQRIARVDVLGRTGPPLPPL